MTTRSQQHALRDRAVPAWWRDAKLGIFVHWTPASIPAFAPVDDDIGALLRSDAPNPLARVPYSEWYENSLRFPDSPVARHHRATYGDRPYAAFARDWERALDHWDPRVWAEEFAETGARYVVFVAKHSDGYCLWPTSVSNPRREQWACPRDVVGEMADAVRGAGMRFGLYYCGGFDWTFDQTPIGSMAGVLRAIPRGDYPAYAEAQVRELIARYRPDVLWGDVAWPAPKAALLQLFRDYYDAVPDGVVNDRWMPWSSLLELRRFEIVRRAIDKGARKQAERDGGLVPPKAPHSDFRTPEYTRFPDIEQRAWEYTRGMDRSFGYNRNSRPEHFIDHDTLLDEFTDVVAKGGNLLVNVGPRGEDATIPDEQLRRLRRLGEFLTANGAALQGTRPWVAAGSGNVRYTARDDTVFAHVLAASASLTLPEVRATTATTCGTLDGRAVAWHDSPGGLVIDEPVVPRRAIALRGVDARA